VFTQYRWEEQVRFQHVIEQLNGAKHSNGSTGRQTHPLRVTLEFADRKELTVKLLDLLHSAFDGQCDSPTVMPGHIQIQLDHFEKGIQALWRRSFCEAGLLFAKASVGPDQRISSSAETYLRICERRTDHLCAPESFENHYAYGVALLNDGRLVEARTELESALRIDPGADYVHYALAACFALCGDIANLYSALRRAIELQPRNRIAARSDPDFQAALHHSSVRELVYGGD
jgi:tetratricopeptide (TPR) repeat protein